MCLLLFWNSILEIVSVVVIDLISKKDFVQALTSISEFDSRHSFSSDLYNIRFFS